MKMKNVLNKLIVVVSIGILLCGYCNQLQSQGIKHNNFYFGLFFQSENMWSSLILGNFSYSRYSIIVKDKGEKIELEKFKLKDYFSLKFSDLFNNTNTGFKLGWQNNMYPIGGYIKIAYRYKKFSLKFPDENNYTTNKIHSIVPSLGLRITPILRGYDKTFYPILEVGVNYEYNFSYKGAYENNLNQINSGFTSSYSIGYGNTNYSKDGLYIREFVIGVDIPHYNTFNKNFTLDNGTTYPYKNVTSHIYRFFTSISIQL
jgi:hypothetical protein